MKVVLIWLPWSRPFVNKLKSSDFCAFPSRSCSLRYSWRETRAEILSWHLLTKQSTIFGVSAVYSRCHPPPSFIVQQPQNVVSSYHARCHNFLAFPAVLVPMFVESEGRRQERVFFRIACSWNMNGSNGVSAFFIWKRRMKVFGQHVPTLTGQRSSSTWSKITFFRRCREIGGAADSRQNKKNKLWNWASGIWEPSWVPKSPSWNVWNPRLRVF